MPTAGEQAAFEAGIKLGALFHQFVGTPVSPESAGSLERAIEASIENQPHCEAVEVTIDRDALEADIGPFGYTGLAGRHVTVTARIETDGKRAVAGMAMVDGYPLMELETVE
ncbi:MAG: dihydroneopterin aldolase family protein [Halodesulfurarchaeum sp.]